MVLELEFPRGRRARVWLDESPPAAFVPTSIVTGLVTPKLVVAASRRIAAVELSVSHGPRASYGLLGAALVALDVQGLDVQIFVNDVGPPYHESISSPPDEVQIGLPAEYSGAVLNGVLKMAEVSGAPDGFSLQFGWATHARVGSSPDIFERVSGLVLRLLMLPEEVPTEHIVSIFR